MSDEIENNTNLTDEQIKAIGKYFEFESDDMYEDIEELDYEHYGLPIIEIEGTEYALAESDDEVHKAVKEYIESSIWSFTPWFIFDNISVDLTIEDIEHIQTRYEDSNDALLSLIDDLDNFTDKAIGMDGAGHFLNFYDGNEIEIDSFFLYRVN